MTYSNLELAESFIKFGELEDALAALAHHLAEAPQDDGARRLRAEVLARLPGDAKLRAALRDLDALAQPIAHDYILRSVLLEKLGQLKEAVSAIAQGQAAHPHDDRLTERYLHLLRAREDTLAQAREIADTLAKEQPQSWRWAQWAGDLAVSDGDDAAALSHYDAALAIIQARYNIDISQAASPLPAGAASDAAALTVGGIYARLLLARADTLTRCDNLERAEADYQAASTLIPGDPMIPFNRGLITARRGDVAAAAALCRPAYASASPLLQEHMRAVLRGDARYKPLSDLLIAS